MLVGHQKQWQFLKRSAELQKLSHAYLFSGPEQVGKKRVAFEFVKFLHCSEKDAKKRPCNVCDSCQAVSKGIHSDALFLEPEQEKREIQISQIRELIYKLCLKPFLSKHKTAIVNQADLMNVQAQNCFLKTLEEPQGNTVLILIAKNPEVLLETIRSRVQEVKFYPVPEKEIENFLANMGVPKSRIRQILEICLGRPGRALELIQNSQELERQQRQAEEFIKVLNSDLASRFQYAHLLSKTDLKETLEPLLIYLRELLFFKAGALKNPVFLSDSLSKASLSQIKKTIEFLLLANFLITTKNINRRLALETLMLQL